MFRIVTGAVITLIGLVFLIGGIMESEGSAIVGAVIAVIGVAILLNKKEDEIEEIKSDKHEDPS